MSDQINVNAIANTLQTKVDLPTGSSQSDIDFVVEKQEPTASNNYTWYRLYKSGWIEQGGFNTALNECSTTSVTFLKAMKTTDYAVFAIQTNQSTATDAEVGIQFTPSTTTQAILSCHYINPNTTYVSWEVKGLSE